MKNYFETQNIKIHKDPGPAGYTRVKILHYVENSFKDEITKTVLYFFCISNLKKATTSTMQVQIICIIMYTILNRFILFFIIFTFKIVFIYCRNNFINICHHEEDFGLKVKSHNFFSTSHGKSPCDGCGAVVKRTVRRASLQRTSEKPILNPKDMYDYVSENIDGIR